MNKKVGLAGLVLLLMLVIPGYLMAAATCSETRYDYRIFNRCEESVDFSTAGQNVWGPGNKAPNPALLKILSDSWSSGLGANKKIGVTNFGTFGGALSAHASGKFGLYLGLEGLGGGTVDVNYPVTMRLLGPPERGFRSGRLMNIRFYGNSRYDSSNPRRLSSAGILTAGKFSMWGDLALGASMGGSFCFFKCIGIPLPGINFSVADLVRFVHNVTQIPGASDKLIVYEIPAGMRSFTFGPLWDVFTNVLQGVCPSGQVEIPKNSKISEKSGLSGCLGFPQLTQASQVDGNGVGLLATDQRTLIARNQNTFANIDLDVDYWASKIKGIPPLSYSKTVPEGPSPRKATVSVDGLDITANNKLTLKQTLTFTPEPMVTLTFPVAINYDLHQYGRRVRSGSGTQVNLRWGEEIYFYGPEGDFDIQTTYALPNRFSNDTELDYTVSMNEAILKGNFNLGSHAIGQSPIPVCWVDWKGWHCYYPSIPSPKVDFTLGPLKSFNQHVKTLRDSQLFDNNQPPWELQGFQVVQGTPLRYRPNQPPVVALSGEPNVALPEGSAVSIDYSGTYDPEGDPVVAEFSVYAGGQFQFTPTDDAINRRVNFILGDNKTYTLQARVRDQSTAAWVWSQAAVSMSATNVAPSISGMANVAVAEGEPVNMPVHISDPGIYDSQVVTMNWGDGSPVEEHRFPGYIKTYAISYPGGGGDINYQHVYADNGTYTIQVCATDSDAGRRCETAQVTVSNQIPTITSQGNVFVTSPLGLGSNLQIEMQLFGTFNDKGTLDSHTARLIWDDASENVLTVRETPFGPPGSTAGLDGKVSAGLQHTYSSAGTKTTQICITDDEAAEQCVAGPQIIVASADLAITGTATPVDAPIGDLITYQYDITNNGTMQADNVEVKIDLPSGGNGQETTLVSAKRSISQGALEQKLLPFDLNLQAANFNFGNAIAVMGDTLAVSNDAGNGAVYLFQRVGDNWVAGPKLEASDGIFNDDFGYAIAISPDESTIAIGAPGVDKGSATYTNEGAVYVFRRNDKGTATKADDTWSEEATRLIDPESAPGAQLGHSVAIEGDWVVAGAFGDDVLDDSNTLQVSAGTVALFQRVGTAWSLQQRISETPVVGDRLYGIRVAIASGRIAIAGGEGDNTSGMVDIYQQGSGEWIQTQRLNDPTNFQFGVSGMALQGDRLLLLSGWGGREGLLQSYHYSDSGFMSDGDFPIKIRQGVALDGDHAVVGSYEYVAGGVTGVARTLQWDGAGWQPEGILLPSNPADRSYLFASDRVAVTGRTVVAGSSLAPQAGKLGMGVVYVMQTCEERPSGHIVCGFGALPSGASRKVEAIVSVGCALSPGYSLSTQATVEGQAIDPQTANNLSQSTRITSGPAGGFCGVDGTPPVISPVLTGTLGDNGWYRSTVDLTWAVNDPDSAVTASSGCNATQLQTDSGGSIYHCGATSSGGTANRRIVVKRDATAPGISFNPVGTPGSNGWFTSPVTAHFNCSDVLSGIAGCTVDSVIASEGRHNAIQGVATDQAGNSSSLLASVSIDMTPPTLTASRTLPNESGWNNTPVTVTYSCGDALSGVSSCPGAAVMSSEGSGQRLSQTVFDNAGLSSSLTVVGINIDRTAPQVQLTFDPPANGQGWNTSDVAVNFTCSDTLSGIADCPAPVVYTTEGVTPGVILSVADKAGNLKTLQAGPVKLDRTPPEIHATITPSVDANGVRPLPVTVRFNCSDVLSGIAECPADVILSTSGMDQSLQVAATDLAGNTADLTLANLNLGVPALQALTGHQTLAEGSALSMPLVRVTSLAMTEGVAQVNWGDGVVESVALTPEGDNGVLDTTHRYADDGDYIITISVAPLIGNPLAVTLRAKVTNQAPQIDSVDFLRLGKQPPVQRMTANNTDTRLGLTTTSVYTQDALSLQIGFTDSGTADIHSARIDWGDGSGVEQVNASESPTTPYSAGSQTGQIIASHIYQTAGEYTGQACVSDSQQAQTCTDFRVTVLQSDLPALSCSIGFGAPQVKDTGVTLPLESQVSGANVESILWSYFGGDTGLFDDAAGINPLLLLPPGDGSERTVAVSFGARVNFPSGGGSNCAVSACLVLAGDGSVRDCTLLERPETSKSIPTWSDGWRWLTVLLIALMVLWRLRSMAARGL